MRLLLLLALLASSGCAVPGAAPLPPDGPGPTVPTQPAPPTPGQALADLDAARGLWEREGPASYTMTLQRNCFCPSDWRGPFAVTVREGAVESATYEDQPADLERVLTVDALFDLLADAYAEGAALVRVEYHDTLGYPTSLYIDRDEMMADEEIGYTVADLEALDG